MRPESSLFGFSGSGGTVCMYNVKTTTDCEKEEFRTALAVWKTPPNLAENLALTALEIWDSRTPSPFIPGNVLWPSLDTITEALETLLRQRGFDPLQKPASVANKIVVSVLQATPRFKCNRKPLLRAVFSSVIGIHKKLKPVGTLHVRFSVQGDYFIIEFYNEGARRFTRIFNYKDDRVTILQLDCIPAAVKNGRMGGREDLNPSGIRAGIDDANDFITRS
jgi:hypothetical protein